MQGAAKYLSSSLTVTCCSIWTACLWYSSWAWTSAESWLTCSICRAVGGNHAVVTTFLSLSSLYYLAHKTELPLTQIPVLGHAVTMWWARLRHRVLQAPNRLKIKCPYARKLQYCEEKQLKSESWRSHNSHQTGSCLARTFWWGFGWFYWFPIGKHTLMKGFIALYTFHAKSILVLLIKMWILISHMRHHGRQCSVKENLLSSLSLICNVKELGQVTFGFIPALIV